MNNDFNLSVDRFNFDSTNSSIYNYNCHSYDCENVDNCFSKNESIINSIHLCNEFTGENGKLNNHDMYEGPTRAEIFARDNHSNNMSQGCNDLSSYGNSHQTTHMYNETSLVIENDICISSDCLFTNKGQSSAINIAPLSSSQLPRWLPI
jgi:hypothetical protein